jgi:hypothetical protein
MDSVASEPTHHPPNLSKLYKHLIKTNINKYYLVPDLHPDEELSDDRISKLIEQFVSEFTEQYPTSGPPLYMGSLDQALTHSLYNQKDVCFSLLLKGKF